MSHTDPPRTDPPRTDPPRTDPSKTELSNGFTDFFTELPNEFWRRAASPESTAAEVRFIDMRLGLQPGARILDVPCGSGRHALALAARGHRVTALDGSAEAIDHARRAAAVAGQHVVWIEADMRDLPQGAAFDAAVCMGNSFGYLDLAGTRDFVVALAGALRPGGALVVDFNGTAETVLPGYRGEPRTMQTGDITVEATSEYDVVGSRMRSSYHFTRGSQQLTATAIHHVYTSAHLGQLLSDAGFIDVQRYAGPDGAPYHLGAGRLVLTARRAGGSPTRDTSAP